MKILYIITKSNWGGAQRHVYDLAVEMKKKDHIAVVALGGDGILRKKLEDAGIKTHSIGQLGRNISLHNDSISLKNIYSIIKREKPDIVHLHSSKVGVLGAIAGRILRIKQIIFTVHGWAFNEDRPLLQKILIVLFSWFTMLSVHKTIVLSNREYEQAFRFPWVKKKITLCPLGIRQSAFMSIDGSRQLFSKLCGIELVELNKMNIIGTIAELHPNKGLFFLLKAIEQVVREHPNTVCMIIGDGEMKDSLKQMIEKMRLKDHVKLLGYIDDASHYLKAFNIFVLPSIKEGLPYVILEAGFASLPVIATTVGGVPEIIEDMRSGVLVQTKNGRELAHAMSFMIEHPHMRRQYGSALRDSVIQKFSLEKMIENISTIYNK